MSLWAFNLESVGLNFDLKAPPVSEVTVIAPSIAPHSPK